MRRAWLLLAAAAVIIAAGGTAFSLTQHVPEGDGLYWAVTTASTVGYGDETPHNPAGKIIAVVVMLTAIPVLAAVFALLTGFHLRSHLRDSEQRIKDHIEDRLTPQRRRQDPGATGERKVTKENGDSADERRRRGEAAAERVRAENAAAEIREAARKVREERS